MIEYKDFNIQVYYDTVFDEKTKGWFYPLEIQKWAKNTMIKSNWLYLGNYAELLLLNEKLLNELINLPMNTKIILKPYYDII